MRWSRWLGADVFRRHASMFSTGQLHNVLFGIVKTGPAGQRVVVLVVEYLLRGIRYETPPPWHA